MTFKNATLLAIAGLISASLAGTPLLHAQEAPASAPPSAAVPAPVQHASPSNELHKSGEAAEDALNSAGQSIKHAYKATKYEVGNAALTARVKTALMADSFTKGFTVHVNSDHGVVTLTGTVNSPAAARRTAQVVQNVNGVQLVRNELTWPAG